MERYKNLHFEARPRYTGGSPGMVSERQARQLAAEEKSSYEHALSGILGAEAKAKAERDGLGPVPDEKGVLRGIAEEVVEHTDHFRVLDLPTGITYRRDFHSTKKPKPCKKGCQDFERAKREHAALA